MLSLSGFLESVIAQNPRYRRLAYPENPPLFRPALAASFHQLNDSCLLAGGEFRFPCRERWGRI